MRIQSLKRIADSHGDASGYYVTFLDNHDMNTRIRARLGEEKAAMALTCLFTMIGIPCLYYGTEQGLSGSGDTRESVREAMWGQVAFDKQHQCHGRIQELSQWRARLPVLRYGRQYFRPCSGDGILAFSRILSTTECVVAANTSTTASRSIHILVDRHLNRQGDQVTCVFSSLGNGAQPEPVAYHGPVASIHVHLKPMESQIPAR